MKPWWAYPPGDERQQRKAEDAKRRPDEGIHHYARLCRKFKLRHDGNIKARMDGDKLVLSRGSHSYAMPLELCDRFYLATVLEILQRERPASTNQLPPEKDRMRIA